jgi:hypothetical protein
MSPEPAAAAFSFLDGLPARGPDPELRDGLMTFGQFVGVWAMDVEYYGETGQRTYHGRWEWSFAWVLGGRAVQDVIVVLDPADPAGAAGPADPAGPAGAAGAAGAEVRRPGGTTIRYLHADSGEWTVFWLGITSGITVQLRARPAGDTIVLEGPDPDGTLNLWTFSHITPSSFTWTGRESRDDGQTWHVNQRMLATRLR